MSKIYILGVGDILADFGTQNVDTSEWDKPHVDDSEGLHELFSFESKVPTPMLNVLKPLAYILKTSISLKLQNFNIHI